MEQKHKRRWSRLLWSFVAFALIAIAYVSINVARNPEFAKRANETNKEFEERKMVKELFDPNTPPPPIAGSAPQADISSDISELFEVAPSDIERANEPKKETKQELAVQKMAQKLFEVPSNSNNQVKRGDR